ncbi:MAG: PAS domain S-box protein [Bacteroidota bacterium]
MKHNLVDSNGIDISVTNSPREEIGLFKQQLTTHRPASMALLSWDVFMDGIHERMFDTKQENEIKQIFYFANKFNWQNNLRAIFSENDYEAIVITDRYQKIIWVNDGFTSMTGYSKTFAINKTPKFLQGEHTSEETRKRIKTKIQRDKPFTDVIVNHRKDKSIYKCELKIFPLHGEETTHYMALEKQVV